MKYHILLGILLWTIAAAFAQPNASARDTPLTTEGQRTSPALKEKPSNHGKSGKPATPLAKPEFGEEDEIQEEPEVDEEGPDCEGCLLAYRSQTPTTYRVAGLHAVAGSRAPCPVRLTNAPEISARA